MRWWSILIALCLASSVQAEVDYLKEVKPLLAARCASCHGALAQKAKLRVDTAAFLKQGGRSGPAIVAGKGADSLLIHAVQGKERDRMPPESDGVALSETQIKLLQTWIDEGANAPANEAIPDDPRQHWSFQKPVRPSVPASEFRHPIDAFIAAERTRQQLTAVPSTDQATLLRRVTLDLTGLPPTTAELEAFLADSSPNAYAKVVDRLLASPQYGERWARHWMDVWRYADWHGRRMVPDVWNSAPQIWRWRDWIVRSLNTDKGYDQMVREMLAADEVAPTDEEAGYATGYLIRNWYALNRNDWMRANVEHVGKAFLGLTFNCAHCHDHKYDPISQDDYFRFRAFFEPISVRQDRVAGEADPGPFQEYDYSVLRKVQRLGAVRIYDKFPEASTWFYTGGDERNRVATRGSMPAGVPNFLTAKPLSIQPIQLPRESWQPALRPALIASLLDEARTAIRISEAEMQAARQTADASLPDLRQKLAAAESAFAQAKQTLGDGHGGALAGKQSLLLDAGQGRRTVQRELKQIATLPEGATLTFHVQLLTDTHFNFQLARDLKQGLTAGYVAFEKGRLTSYKPASFVEFEVGKYDFATQNRLECSLTMQPSKDQALLTVRTPSDNKVLVNAVPVALNGWQPVKGLLFDARAGSRVAVDEVRFEANNKPLARFDFEAPTYTDGRDIIGVDGWIGSSYNQGTGSSLISAIIGNSKLASELQKVRAARNAVIAAEANVTLATAKHQAAVANLASIEARLAADQAGASERETLARRASRLHHEAMVLQAEADVLAKDRAGMPAPLATARAALDKAKAALVDDKQALVYPSIGPKYPEQSTGRRKALVEWMTDRNNPLAARVAVNHVWLRHFHSPLVATVNDFGRNGAKPTHPALLDWLAVEFMESGWSMKHLHRLIVTSATYQLSSNSKGHEANTKRDPENKYLWRMNVGRMEAEVVRDSLLFSADTLDLHMGGQELENSTALTTKRRSLYYSCQPEVDGKSQLGALFDAPEATDCYRRTRSVIPQQALALTNSDLVHDLSVRIAARLWQALTPMQQQDATAFVTRAYAHLLTRSPTTAELRLCVEFLQSSNADATKQRESLIRAILNHNDFIAIR